jgi:HPr kinase/phosphorylase
MKNKVNPRLAIKDFCRRAEEVLKLRPAAGKIAFLKTEGRLPRKLGSVFQIWGKKDLQDLKKLSPKERTESINEKIKEGVVCIILADGLNFFPEIKAEVKKRALALFSSSLSHKECLERMRRLIRSTSSHQILTSGELLEIFGLGVIIRGDSGIGKSECALELISRGFRFVSDDVILVRREADGKLMGQAPPLTRYFMEIRGLGIINIKAIFGSNAISKQAKIDLVISLKKLQRRREYDRIGLRFPEDQEILGVKIPQINIPVAPGRNIATLIEVACKSHILKKRGYHAPLALVRKHNRALSVH